MDSLNLFSDLTATSYSNIFPVPEDMTKEDWRLGMIFHVENPEVYLKLKALSFDALAKGIKHWSIKGFWEIARYDFAVHTNSVQFKLNNNLTPFYARFLMQRHPELVGFFSTRIAK